MLGYNPSNLFHLKSISVLLSVIKTYLLISHTLQVQEHRTYHKLPWLMGQSGNHRLFELQQRLLVAQLNRQMKAEGLLGFKKRRVSCWDLLKIYQDEFVLK